MKKPDKTGIDAEGQRLWRAVTARVHPYGKSRKKPPDDAPPPQPPRRARDKVPPPPPPPATGTGFDRATRTKFERGKLPIDGRLDLHGMTQQEAFIALNNFIAGAAARHLRTVLVITGKGSAGGGVLRKMLPQWLENADLARYVLAVSPAQAKDGGGGAFYIRLRRKK